MRVTSNTFAESLKPQLERLTVNQLRLQQQLATGQRITDPSDDPAAMARVLEIQSEKREIGQYQRNISRLDSVNNVTFGHVEALQNVNQRATELSFRATSVSGTESFDAYALEVNALIEEAVDVANAKYLDNYIFAGAAVETLPYSVTRDIDGNITAVSYDGSTANAEVSISENAKVDAYHDPASNQQIEDFLNHLVALRDAMGTYDDANVRTAADDLFTDEDNMVVMISNVSSDILRLEVAQTQQQEMYRNLDDRISVEADADFAETLVNLTTTQNAYQAALSSSSRVLQQSLLDFV